MVGVEVVLVFYFFDGHAVPPFHRFLLRGVGVDGRDLLIAGQVGQKYVELVPVVGAENLEVVSRVDFLVSNQNP